MEHFDLEIIREVTKLYATFTGYGFALATFFVIACFGVYKVFNTFCSLTK